MVAYQAVKASALAVTCNSRWHIWIWIAPYADSARQ